MNRIDVNGWRALRPRGSGKSSKQAANLLIETSKAAEDFMNRFAATKQPLIRYMRFPCLSPGAAWSV
jgi:hypothetical protein